MTISPTLHNDTTDKPNWAQWPLRSLSLSGQFSVSYIRQSSASPRPPCDGTISLVSVWPSPRQTPGPPGSYSSNSIEDLKHVVGHMAWSGLSDFDKTESDWREPLYTVETHAHRGVFCTPASDNLPQLWESGHIIFIDLVLRESGLRQVTYFGTGPYYVLATGTLVTTDQLARVRGYTPHYL